MELLPCPLCGRNVSMHKWPSRDGSIVWVEIMHQTTIDCGISFIDLEDIAEKKWNSRLYFNSDISETNKKQPQAITPK